MGRYRSKVWQVRISLTLTLASVYDLNFIKIISELDRNIVEIIRGQ